MLFGQPQGHSTVNRAEPWLQLSPAGGAVPAEISDHTACVNVLGSEDPRGLG